MKSLSLLIILLIFSSQSFAAGKFQYNINFGTDTPDEGETRSGAATMVQFNVVNGKGIFKLGGAFTYLTGTQFSQGDFNLGTYIYPLQGASKSPLQPFVFAMGKLGFGTLDLKARMDTGFGLGAGVDILWSKSWGMTIAMEQHAATESSTRLWAGLLFH